MYPHSNYYLNVSLLQAYPAFISMLYTCLTLLTSVIALPQPLPNPVDAIPTFTSANFGMSPASLSSRPMLHSLTSSQNIQENQRDQDYQAR